MYLVTAPVSRCDRVANHALMRGGGSWLGSTKFAIYEAASIRIAPN